MKIFFIFLLAIVPVMVDSVQLDLLVKAGGCASGWKEYNGHCYKAVATNLTAPEAELACNRDGAQLASIHSRDENSFLNILLDSVDSNRTGWFYIGMRLKRKPASDELLSAYWTDGSAMGFGDPVVGGNGTYPWGYYKDKGSKPEPNNNRGIETCAAFGHDSGVRPLPTSVGWLDIPCNGKQDAVDQFGYVCKK